MSFTYVSPIHIYIIIYLDVSFAVFKVTTRWQHAVPAPALDVLGAVLKSVPTSLSKDRVLRPMCKLTFGKTVLFVLKETVLSARLKIKHLDNRSHTCLMKYNQTDFAYFGVRMVS